MRTLCFGAVNIDHVYQVPHFVVEGETMSSMDYQMNMGGKGFNQALALANAGARTFFAGCVGEDGIMLRRFLEAHSVDTGFLKTVARSTGHAVIQVNQSGQNCILLYGGANHEISIAQIEQTFMAFQRGDYLLLQNEVPRLPELIGAAKSKGMVVVLNPSPCTKALLELPFSQIDWLILNEVEAAALCFERDASRMLSALHDRFPSCAIVLTLGKRGAYCCKDGITCYSPAYQVDAVDTTAAGDTFTGYFICGITQGLPVAASMRLAAAAAAISVTRHGAANSIPMREETEAFIKERVADDV